MADGTLRPLTPPSRITETPPHAARREGPEAARSAALPAHEASSLGAHHSSGAVFVDRSKDARLESRAPSNEPPYTTALLLKLSAALGEIVADHPSAAGSPAGLTRAAHTADILLAHGIALVEPDRHRHWIDETVYSGALFRLHVGLREAPPDLPTITLPQDLFV